MQGSCRGNHIDGVTRIYLRNVFEVLNTCLRVTQFPQNFADANLGTDKIVIGRNAGIQPQRTREFLPLLCDPRHVIKSIVDIIAGGQQRGKLILRIVIIIGPKLEKTQAPQQERIFRLFFPQFLQHPPCLFFPAGLCQKKSVFHVQ